MRISFDLDGVLVDFSKHTIDFLRKCGWNLPSDYEHTVWSFQDIMSEEQWSRVLGEMLSEEDAWIKFPAFKRSVRVLRDYLKRHGREDVFYITSRPPACGASTTIQSACWLLNKGLGPTSNIVVCDGHLSKTDAISELGIKYHLDDLPSVVNHCLSSCKAYLLDTPYNRKEKVQNRIFSIDEFILEVELAEA